MSDETDEAEVVVPFKRPATPPTSGLPAQGTPSFSDMLVTVEMLNQQLFILQQATTALLACSTERTRQLAFSAVVQSGPGYQSAFDIWPADVARPQVADMIKIYSALFRVGS